MDRIFQQARLEAFAIQPSVAVVLDMDGVIFKTSMLKNRVMLSLFSDYPNRFDAISEFIHANGGVPRKVKITEILEQILQIPANADRLSRYLSRYADVLEPLLEDAPLVDGVAAFLLQSSVTFFVSSTAPDEEVERQLASRNLLSRFADIFGLSTPKPDALRSIRRRNGQSRIVFLGDSISDLEAARKANVAFVGVACEQDNFQGVDIIKIRDFASPEVVWSCIDAAWKAHATEPR